MTNSETKWDIYDCILRSNKLSNKKNTIKNAQASFLNIISDNPAFQENAKRNGNIQPMLVTRISTNECSVQVLPGESIFIGDLVECYNENWIVVELFSDEYGMIFGKMWLCNYLCNFQNITSEIFKYYAVIDDGSYSKSEKNIKTTDSYYNLYITLDENTEKLFIDKRLAIGTMYDKNQKKILQVMKIVWIDKQELNFGKGSHLLKIRLSADVFNEEKDNIEYLICDYIEQNIQNTIDENNDSDDDIYISGKDTLKIGTSRTYLIEGNSSHNNYTWIINNEKCKLTYNGLTCKIYIPLDAELIGEKLLLTAIDNSKQDYEITKEVEVINIG